MAIRAARFAQWGMSLTLAPGTAWNDVLARVAAAAPEALTADRLRNLYAGRWHDVGTPAELRTPVDGTLPAGRRS